MQKWYSEIVDAYGAPSERIEFSPNEITGLASVFPASLKGFFLEMGRSVLRRGRIQTCHPNDMEGVLSLIFNVDREFSSDKCFAFAYSAFGDIFFWMEDFGYGRLSLYEGHVFQKNLVKGRRPGSEAINAVSVPFWLSDEALDYGDETGRPLFEQARHGLGQLEISECYGFVPVLAFGGRRDIGDLKRLKAAEHFSIVAQTMDYHLMDVQGYGKIAKIRRIGSR
ncbi:hypothetical protein GA0061103_6387 [Rhizobium multihospitium]|uniref:DUF1851 domain-containing protein n=2 Tax=Rhizobium multihospitium TaxID=410764 RepID=A0A1C3WV31_9HYPH|nr:hypothetical protein GA0061103_6387 [Rhizobium multihospitium]